MNKRPAIPPTSCFDDEPRMPAPGATATSTKGILPLMNGESGEKIGTVAPQRKRKAHMVSREGKQGAAIWRTNTMVEKHELSSWSLMCSSKAAECDSQLLKTHFGEYYLKQSLFGSGVKQLHAPGDPVYAMWTPTEDWHPGSVVGRNRGGAGGGGYHVSFDDGDEDHDLCESLVFSKEDYEWSRSGEGHTDDDLKGVHHWTGSDRPYLKDRGWYTTDHTGDFMFASVCAAMIARDDGEVHARGAALTGADLNMPEQWTIYCDGRHPTRNALHGAPSQDKTLPSVEDESAQPDHVKSCKGNEDEMPGFNQQVGIRFQSAENDFSVATQPIAPSYLDAFDEDTLPGLIESEAPDNVKVKAELSSKIPDFSYGVTVQHRMRRRKQRLSSNRTCHGTPRKVFRRGCHPKCITTVLGGSGVDPAPTVKVPPAMENAGNSFIAPGEFYFAGRSDWNPWTPYFSGDSGFIHREFVEADGREKQKFHMFLNCSKKSYEQHYHGPKARGKYLYLGRYRVVPDDEGVLSVTFLFQSLTSESQWTMADYYRRINCFGYESLVREEHFAAAKGVVESEREGKWELLSDEKRESHAWVQLLLDTKHSIEVLHVEFVDYDEELYNTLVKMNAFNGEVAVEEHQLGPL